jgi:4-amino-4-deoxy-L-arabinose transferase-like glycosyltransferase
VLRLIRKHRNFFLGITLAGLLLRLFFVVYFPAITDDSRVYADLGTNWLQHGIYGQTQGGHPEKPNLPTDARLPGYPAFLAAIFWLFGIGNFRPVMLAQILVDLMTCLLVADLARRAVSDRAARIAFALAALCPFLANYTAAVLTETLEIFFTVLALDFATAGLQRMRNGGVGVNRLWAAAGGAIAVCILLRPDGGILLASVVFYLAITAAKEVHKRQSLQSFLIAGVVVAVFALGPLVPWTIRNFRTMHHFQPLAPRYANDADELIPRGFNRWVKTWMVDYTSVEEIYWNIPGQELDSKKLPSRALDVDTIAVISDYNESQDISPELDARFEALAVSRIRAHPIRYYVVLPILRVADMWLRPRTELLPADPRWWEFHDDTKESIVAVGFGVLNLAYVGGALLALIYLYLPSRKSPGVRRAGLFVIFLLLRSAFLGTLENPEPRYTLECYPVIIVCAAAYVARLTEQQQSEP